MTNKDNIDKTVFIKDRDIEERYWLNKLSGELKISNFPYDHNKKVSGICTKSVKFRFDKDIYEKLNKLSNDSYTRLHIILITGLTILLNKYTNNNDILLGTSIYNQDIEADFINTILILRNKIKDDILFKELLLQIRDIIIEAEENQNYPVDILLQKLKIPYAKEDTFPLFDVVILLENIQNSSHIQDVKCNILFSFFKHNNYLEGTVNYNSSLYEEKTILRIISHYQEIFRKAFINLNIPVADLDILSAEERKQILYDFNNTKTDYPKNKTIHELFEEQVLKTPNNTSLEYQEDKLSYDLLNSRSNQVAWQLQKLGVNTNCIVGIMLDNSFDLITGILGILKAGAAYLPIDILYPLKRKEFIINDCNLDILLTNNQLIKDNEENLQNTSIKNLININDLPDYNEISSNPGRTAKPSDICYVIYTSGSTGNPKGVSIKHQGLTNYIYWATQMYNVPGRMNFPLYSSVSFDLTVTSIYTPLITGNKIIIYNETNINETLEKIFQNDQIGVVKITPAHLSVLDNIKIDNSKIRKLIVGGDQLTVSIADKIHKKFDGIELYNEYGPTEAVVGCMIYKNIPELDKGINVPIGKPISNGSIYILDNQQKPVCDGVSGEMFIGGDGLSLGYINNPELSKNKFINNPFTEGESLYCTGDLARRLPDGNIEFLGRIDDQVKIRGYRIELGEIEHVLQKHENIQESVVLAREENEDKYLCAYIVLQGIFNQEEIYRYLSTNLPEYMIPSYFVEMDELPLTLNGKVDKISLPSPKINTSNNYIAPSNYIEEKLIAIWSEILNIPQVEISANVNFFTIGGHSLKATLLIGRIYKEFEVEFPLHDVFLYTKIKEQADLIQHSTKKDFVSIPKAKDKKYYPLSSAQKRLYLLQEMEQESTVYNMPYIITLGEETDRNKIEEVFRQLIKRHESFRTSFVIEGEEPVQRIHEQVEFKLEEFEIAKEEEQNYRNQFIQAFDLSKAPLLRVYKVEVKGESSLLMIDMHHIISDGVSHEVLENDFQRLYSGEKLAPLSFQYKDYSERQNSEEQKLKVKEQEDYWIRKFEEEIPVLNLPIDKIRPAIQSHEGARVSFALSKEETQHIKSLAQENDLTYYMSVLSVLNILLSKLSGQEDIIVGTPIAGRNHRDLENIVGMFVNTLAIRNEVDGSNSLKEFTKKLKQNTIEAYENQDYQFEELVESISIERDISRNPLFDVMFSFQNQTDSKVDLSGITTDKYIHRSGLSKFDLTLTAVVYGEQLMLSFEYCTKLFKAETIERYIGYFKQIVNQLTINSEIELSAIEIISKEEKQQLLHDFNNTEADYPKDKTIHQLFEEQVERTPENTVLVFEGKEMTYRDLNSKSNYLARLLRKKGVGSEMIIGLMVESSFELIIGIMGILKAGGAYLPIDPMLPESRKQFMLNNSHSNILLTISGIESNIYSEETLFLDSENIYQGRSENLNHINESSDSCYIIYTSGSTGVPKGVVIEHTSVVNFIYSMYNDFNGGFSNLDCCLSLTRFTFDVSVAEYFLPMSFGAKIVFYNSKEVSDIKLLTQAIVDYGITFTYIPPSLLRNVYSLLIQQVDKVKLNKMLVGVEPIKDEILEDYLNLNEDFNIINGYGPTESTICATRYLYKSHLVKNTIVPIGQGVSNSNIYLLDRYNKLVPIGVLGELCISGVGLSRGYLNNAELTSEKFIDHPFKVRERLYKTGDLARWLPDGNIEFSGRIDHQVKIRGFRIELGEIENGLLKHNNIKESVVLDIEENGDKYLCAYIVAEEKFSQDEVRTFLSASLPDYMIPSYFVELKKIPLNSNGKVNRKALLPPKIKAGEDYVEPSNEIEEKLVKIWSKVLNINKEDISVNANFFSIGGHSLKATVLTSNIHKEIGVEFPIRKIFLHQTIKSQASQIEKSTKKEFVSISKVEKQSNYPLSSAQKRLYLLQQMDLESTAYNMPYSIPLGEGVDKNKIESIFQKLILRHESFRTSFEIEGETPVQRIHNHVNFHVEQVEIDKSSENDTRIKFIKSFDLSRAPLLRVSILIIKGEGSRLLIDMHHIISDGISQRILEREFHLLYSEEDLPDLQIQYKDFCHWQQSKEQQSKLKEQEAFWISQFEEKIPVLNLPTDYNRPVLQSSKGANVSFILSKEETKHIKQLTKNNDLTLYMGLLSIYSIFLSRISGQQDIVVGTPIAGRNHADLEDVVGIFINTLAVRNNIDRDKRLGEYLQEIKQTTLNAFENQDYQFEDLVEKVSVERDTSRNPIFDVMFNMLNQAEYSEGLSTFDSDKYIHHQSVSKNDLKLSAIDYSENIRLVITYSTKLFKPESIERFISYLKNIIVSIGTNPNQKLSEIDLLQSSEKENILKEFLEIKNIKIPNTTIQSKLDTVFEIHSDKIAIVGDNIHITYSELEKQSRKISKYLDSNNIKECEIGVFLEDKIENIISMLGIIRAGCIYVPKSNVVPLINKEIDIVITNIKTDHVISIIYDDVINQINPDINEIECYSNENIAVFRTFSEKNKIKKIILTNKNLIAFIDWFTVDYKIDTRSKSLLLSDFDLPVNLYEILSSLSSGGLVCISNLIHDYENIVSDDLNLIFENDTPLLNKIESNDNSDRPYLLPISANSSITLKNKIDDIGKILQRNRQLNLNALSYTLSESGSLSYKKSFIAKSKNELVKHISDYCSNEFDTKKTLENSKIVFMYSGLGSQYINMGKNLYESVPYFKETMDNCFSILEPNVDFEPKSVLYPINSDQEESREKLKSISYSAPLKFIYEYSLTKLLIKWGIKPDALIGHSFGEYVAASISNLISLPDMLKLIVTRSKLMLKTPEGAMTTVFKSAEVIKPLLFGSISIAAINGSENCIISGLPDEIVELENKLNKMGMLYIRLNFDRASHSSLMNLIEEEFNVVTSEISFQEPQIPYVSCLTGSYISKEDLTKDFWFNQIRSTVNFSAGLDQILTNDRSIIIEIGPGQNLMQIVKQHSNFDKTRHSLFDVTKHQNNKLLDLEYLYSKIGKLWEEGVYIDIKGINKKDESIIELNINKYSLPKIIDKFKISHLISSSNTIVQRLYSKADSEHSNLQYLFFYNSHFTPGNILEFESNYSNNTKFTNLYGTELTSIINSGTEIQLNKESLNKKFIGNKSAFSNITILDKHKKPCGIGVPGDIYVNKLFKEYSENINQDLLGSKIKREENSIIKTGDIGRITSERTIEYLGSVSGRKRVRNYYIDLDDIEKNLKEQDFVEDLLINIKNNKDELICYVEFTEERESKSNRDLLLKLRNAFLKTYSPIFLPDTFIVIKNMPKDNSGRIDKRKLLSIKLIESKIQDEEPNLTQSIIITLWSEVLGVEVSKISIKSDFFEMGGQSLKGVQLISKLHKEFNVQVPLVELFKTPTVEGLEEYINLLSRVKNKVKEEFVDKIII